MPEEGIGGADVKVTVRGSMELGPPCRIPKFTCISAPHRMELAPTDLNFQTLAKLLPSLSFLFYIYIYAYIEVIYKFIYYWVLVAAALDLKCSL